MCESQMKSQNYLIEYREKSVHWHIVCSKTMKI